MYIKFLITIGIGAVVLFIYWFLTVQIFKNSLIFYFICFSIGYKLIRILYEWYHLWSLDVPEKLLLHQKFSVDILTTYFPGEPIEMLKKTLLAMKRVENVQQTILCSEGENDELRQFCCQNDIQFIPRFETTDAKAGNINHGLQYSKADICIILDPDHQPYSNFINEVLPFFEDEKVGFVQVVQSYSNQNESFIANAAAEQTYSFYGPLMIGMNSKGTVQAIGANCTFRRSALESIGGHAAGLTEDMHTSMLLHSKGWKSIYLPKVLSKGQVPSSFSGFYKQQLKWSRGAFDLLFYFLPSIFTKLTWKQQIHYFSICIYFLLGVVFLIDLIVPIFALLTSQYPLILDFNTFILVVGLLTLITWIIRIYSKKWLIEEKEKVLFWRSGFLMMATWYPYFLGFLYAILKKSVPYLPTEKQNNILNEVKIHFPNLIIIVISLFAIGFGLKRDWNPYSFIMAGFALFNAIVLSFVFIASQRKLLEKIRFTIFIKIQLLFIYIEKLIVILVSKTSFLILLFILLTFYFNTFYKNKPYISSNLIKSTNFFVGQYATTPISFKDSNFTIVSVYIPWGDEEFSKSQDSILDLTLKHRKIPMITWEPWSSTFEQFKNDSLLGNEIGVFSAICDGKYDFYLDKFTEKMKDYKQPFFLRFAHEMGNYQYGWSNNSPEDYILAWQYVHRYFELKKVENVVWVWNPWKKIDVYYPGNEYVDWIGITMLNYGKYNENSYWESFEQLYDWFDKDITKYKKPIMLAEFGSTNFGGNKEEWVRNALFNIKKYYPEILSIVFFNSNQDEFWPDFRTTEDKIDWYLDSLNNYFDSIQMFHNTFISTELTKVNSEITSISNLVDYNVNNEWSTGCKPLTRRQLEYDFNVLALKGYQNILKQKPDIYAKNVYNIANEFGLNVYQGFNFPSNLDYLDNNATDSLRFEVLSFVEKYKNYNGLVSWVLNTSTKDNLNYYFAPPYSFYVEEAFNLFLISLKNDIETIDLKHKVLLNINVPIPNYSDEFINNTLIQGIVNTNGLERVNSDSIKIKNDNFPYFEGKKYVFETIGTSNDKLIFEWILCEKGIYEIKRNYGPKVEIYIPLKHKGNLILYLNIIEGQTIRTIEKKIELG